MNLVKKMAGDVVRLVKYITKENSRMLIIVNAHKNFRWSAVFPVDGKKYELRGSFLLEI